MIVAKNGNIQFSNHECQTILGDNNHCNTSSNVITVDSFQRIKSNDGHYSLSDIIKDVSILPIAVSKEFILRLSGVTSKHFTIRHSTITFRDQISTAIILQDQTLFEEVKKLDEKYQRLYLASIVHDIRTPLNGILGMLEILDQQESRKETKTLINVALCSAKLLLFLTHDITDYSQIEAGVLSVSKERFPPTKIIDETMKLLAFSFDRKGVTLIKNLCSDDTIEIISDKNRYMQIILNLLGNALKFTFRGEVKITIEHNRIEDKLITSVEDTGIGIKEEDLPKLFKFFGKIRENSELNPTGVGLGLAICKKLSERLGGTISVKSVYGKGSTFSFSIACNLRPESAPILKEEEKINFDEIPLEMTEVKKDDSLAVNTSHSFIKVLNRRFLPDSNVAFMLVNRIHNRIILKI